jgi:hypothetical protein
MMPKTPISEDEEVQEKPKTVRFEEVKEIEGKFKYLFFIFS